MLRESTPAKSISEHRTSWIEKQSAFEIIVVTENQDLQRSFNKFDQVGSHSKILSRSNNFPKLKYSV